MCVGQIRQQCYLVLSRIMKMCSSAVLMESLGIRVWLCDSISWKDCQQEATLAMPSSGSDLHWGRYKCGEELQPVQRSGAVDVCLDRTEGSSQPPGEWTDDTAQLRLWVEPDRQPVISTRQLKEMLQLASGTVGVVSKSMFTSYISVWT